jgi:hypothetical protein
MSAFGIVVRVLPSSYHAVDGHWTCSVIRAIAAYEAYAVIRQTSYTAYKKAYLQFDSQG